MKEYIGTMGADYIQYLITDQIATPIEYEQYYTEKFIYMPHSFLANSFAYQAPHMSSPQYTLPSDNNPQINACGAYHTASFVFCNLNKQLKFQPDLFRQWLSILQAVDGSMLCLLENPVESVPFIYSFIENYDKKLKRRVKFMKFIDNPYDNQRRKLTDAMPCRSLP
jgi:predicted O-linked N-acetylglucosamine transferase (SPINDLY family)